MSLVCNLSNLNSLDKATPTNYQLVFPKIPTESNISANNPFVMNIHSAVIPSLSIGVNEVYWQGNKSRYDLNPIEFDPWLVSFVVDSRLANWALLFKWMSYVNNNWNKIAEYHSKYAVDVSMVVTDNYGNSVMELLFVDVWPSTLGEISFSQREGDVVLESTINFNYDYFYVRSETWPIEFSSSSSSVSSSSQSLRSSSSSSSSSSSESSSSSSSSESSSSLSSSISYGGAGCDWVSALINTSNINTPAVQSRTGIYISPTGDYLFTTSTYNDYTYTYSLGTPFDISTMSLVRTWASGIGENNGCWFTDNGLHMLLSRSSAGNEQIRHYTLGTAFDTDTLSFSEAYSQPDVSNRGNTARYYDNGNILVQGGFKYVLGTPYDVSTATPSGDITSLLTDGPYAEMLWDDDGVTLYAVDHTNQRVRKYKLDSYLDFTTINDLGIIVDGLPGLPLTCWVYEEGKVIVGNDGYNTQQPMYEYSYEYSCSSSSSSSSS